MEVARAGDADILRCFDEHVAELEARARVRDAEWPVTAVDLVLAALIAFRPLEVGKHVLVGPAGIAELAPLVEVLALAADIAQPDRKSAGSGESVSVRVNIGGRRIIKK